MTEHLLALGPLYVNTSQPGIHKCLRLQAIHPQSACFSLLEQLTKRTHSWAVNTAHSAAISGTAYHQDGDLNASWGIFISNFT